MKTKIIQKHLKDFQGDAWLVELDGKFYIVSGVSAMFTGWEVLVFPADKEGNVTEWGEVAGGRGMTHEEAIEDLEKRISEEVASLEIKNEEAKP